MSFLPRTMSPGSLAVMQRDKIIWTHQAVARTNWPVENPILQLAASLGYPVIDERVWQLLLQSVTIRGPVERRIQQAVSGDIYLEQGEGDGSRELLEYWNKTLAELDVHTLAREALFTPYTGWTPFGVQAGPTLFDGKPVWSPRNIRAGLPEDFRFTERRDLIECPITGSRIGQSRGYWMTRGPRSTPVIRNQMAWFLPNWGSSSNPYGMGLFGSVLGFQRTLENLKALGTVQFGRASGFLKAERSGRDVTSNSQGTGNITNKDGKDVRKLAADLEEAISKMTATGVLVVPPGWKVEWTENRGVLDQWLNVFRYGDGEIRALLESGTLAVMGGGDDGSRAASRTHAEARLLASRDDARWFNGVFRPWMRTFSAWNADAIAPGAFPDVPQMGLSPDGVSVPRIGPFPSPFRVPMCAVPTVHFTSLETPDLEALKVVSDIGLHPDDAEKLRPDAKGLLRSAMIPMLDEEGEGPRVDLAKPTPTPIIAPGMPPPEEGEVRRELEEPDPTRPFEGAN